MKQNYLRKLKGWALDEKPEKKGKKVISFAVWGANPKYTIGAIKNAVIAKEIYPDWICRFHVGRSTPDDIISQLQDMSNTEVMLREEEGNWTGMFWRFLDASDEDVEVMLSRDTDSRLSLRESLAVEEWVDSDKCFHIIRDNAFHRTEILGGMWGAKKGCVPQIADLIDKHSKGDYWQVDQEFLSAKIWPKIQGEYMLHTDEIYGIYYSQYEVESQRPFSVSLEDNGFYIGQPLDGEDNLL